MIDAPSKIAFLTVLVPRYKVWLYRRLSEMYPGRFYALHGPEQRGTEPQDTGFLGIENDVHRRNRFLNVNGIDFTWSSTVVWTVRNRPRVVIMQDGVRILSNYLVHLISKLRGARVIYYSHGYNHQAAMTRGRISTGASERLRMQMLRLSDGVIVYNGRGAAHLVEKGLRVPVYVSNNTLDTGQRLSLYNEETANGARAVRRRLGIGDEDRVVCFLGRLIQEKKVEFFIDVVRRMARIGPERHGIVIGTGPLQAKLARYAADVPVHFVGEQKDSELAAYLASSDCMFLPCNVGLAIVEAFCAGLPFVTCRDNPHGPEVDFLEHGTNGYAFASTDPDVVAAKLHALLDDSERLSRMASRARETAASVCSPQTMVEAFASAVDGIEPGAGEGHGVAAVIEGPE